MSIKTILFALCFFICSGGALFLPLLGILGYILHYNLGPETKWWAGPLNSLHIRYAYTLAAVTALGMIIHWGKLRFGKSLLLRQEKLLLLFLGVVWFSVWIGPDTIERYTIVDHPSIKMIKIVIITLMMTHIITNLKHLDLLLWAFLVGAFILSLQAYTTPRSAFASGRLENVGGPDFTESNFLAVYLAALLPLVAVQFLRSGWPGKLLSLGTGVLVVNTIVLTRSRGAVVGIAAGMAVAMFCAPKKYRGIIGLGLIAFAAGGYYLTDPQFRERATTITRSEEQRDSSAQSRIELSRASLRIIADHPLGVGAGNFYQTIGRYNENLAGKDAHNTYLRCGTELGLQGLILYGFILFHVFWQLRRDFKRIRNLPAGPVPDTLVLLSFSLTISLVILLACCLTVSLLYVEFTWWLMCLPICLTRVIDNQEAELPAEPVPAGKPAKKPLEPNDEPVR